MAGLEELMHPNIEFVNPEDAIEGGTRKGFAGMRTAFENFFEGAGHAATVEIEEVRERGELVFVRMRIHARGTSSGAEVVSPPIGVVYMFSDGRVFRIEWHYADIDKALAEFERSG
jgi:ketosteroid isomerase-like protein